MRELFCVRKPNGKLVGQCYSRQHAEREIKWLTDAGWPGPFTIDIAPAKERAYRTQWGDVHAEQRAGFKWLPGKIAEFIRRYGRGDGVNDLAEYFDCNIMGITKKARELGFNKRIDDPRTFEKHRGRWTQREEELVNFMYDEGVRLGEISEHIQRGQGAITSRLRVSAPELSTRHSESRFVADGKRRRTSPVAES